MLIPGDCYRQRGRISRSSPARLDCTLLGCHLQGYEEPWFVLTEPAHAKCLWLAMALASVYLLRYSNEPAGDPRQPPLTTAAPSATAPAREGQAKPRRRILSLFRTGLLLAQLLLSVQTQLPQAPFLPEPWPDTPAHLHHPPSLPQNRSP